MNNIDTLNYYKYELILVNKQIIELNSLINMAKDMSWSKLLPRQKYMNDIHDGYKFAKNGLAKRHNDISEKLMKLVAVMPKEIQKINNKFNDLLKSLDFHCNNDTKIKCITNKEGDVYTIKAGITHSWGCYFLFVYKNNQVTYFNSDIVTIEEFEKIYETIF